MGNRIINFAIVEEQPPVKYYPPIEGFEIDRAPSLWELLELPFLDGLLNLLLHQLGRRSGLKKFVKQYPIPQNIEYKRLEINLDDIVSKTYQLVYEYQRRRDSRPRAILIGHKDYKDLRKQVDFYVSPHFVAKLSSDRFMFQGLKVILMPSIDGIVVIGDEEIKDILEHE